jgi:hypothetical protein
MQTFSIAAAHLKCYVNSKLLGYVMSVPAWTVATEWAELREIDNATGAQLTPRTYTVNGTIQILRGRSTGGLEGAGLVPSAEAFLRQKYLVIEIQDRVTQDIIFSAQKCQVISQQWSVSPKGLLIGNFNFRGLTMTNESEG